MKERNGREVVKGRERTSGRGERKRSIRESRREKEEKVSITEGESKSELRERGIFETGFSTSTLNRLGQANLVICF